MIRRTLKETIRPYLFQGRAIVVFGPRRVGKTTLAKAFAQEYGGQFFNCDRLEVKELFYRPTLERLKAVLSPHRFVVFDEVQELPEAGALLKLLVDELPKMQIFATGSCPYGLISKIGEPLTGRKFEFYLLPFSFSEMVRERGLFEEKASIEVRLIYGYYPEIVSKDFKEDRLRELVSNYLLKDILLYSGIKNSEKIFLLLKALALQVGQLVSYNELAQTVGLSVNTVAHYIDILEKMFIIFRLPPYSRNLRTEMKKAKKIYFWDLGVRNAILDLFSPMRDRADVGSLWENFVVAERKKYLLFSNISAKHFFWRTHSGAEVDLIEERNGKLYAYQIKWNPKKKASFPTSFTQTYSANLAVITPENVEVLLLPR